ncbi:hypothetical protein PYW08_012749 [Mythimna loreyi]|uniref:Uncharacterized protein n=1 Tax=Mythimna loreyi TaxID=667449 RepID=A0ACC2Q1L6_9NEOP|nr:hypothetical protein PYW08_012749 [Mythimna loreyi]
MEGRNSHYGVAYPECQHIPKSVRKEVTAAQARALPRSKGENVLPLYERKISDFKRMKLCSLETNENLKCRWESYIKNIEGMKRTAFQFPDISNLHFHNGGIKYLPSLTPANRSSNRRQMGLGPGVDKLGQLPIPYDLYGSKTIAKPKPKPGESSKVKGKQKRKPRERH